MKIKTKQTTENLAKRGKVTLSGECGFSILETAIAMVLMTIVGLGIASAFFYAVGNTNSANDRELAMAVAQQRSEQLRNVAFTDTSLAATSSSGTSATLTRAGRQYSVVTTIVDSNVVNGQPTNKTITVKVTPQSGAQGWATTASSVFASVTLISQRTSLTLGPNRAF